MQGGGGCTAGSNEGEQSKGLFGAHAGCLVLGRAIGPKAVPPPLCPSPPHHTPRPLYRAWRCCQPPRAACPSRPASGPTAAGYALPVAPLAVILRGISKQTAASFGSRARTCHPCTPLASSAARWSRARFEAAVRLRPLGCQREAGTQALKRGIGACPEVSTPLRRGAPSPLEGCAL